MVASCGEAEFLLFRFPMPSNIFPKLSNSESRKSNSLSNSRGGVAVLVVLAVIALSLLPGVNVVLCVVVGNGGGGGNDSTAISCFCLLANENVRLAFLIDHPLERAVGGTGMSWKGR